MTEPKPVVYILHGEDTFAMTEFVKGLEARLGDPATAEMNVTRLDGRTAAENDLRMATGAAPFLADRRLVFLTQPFARLAGEAARARFLDLLEHLPETTGLVLIIEDEKVRRRGEWFWDVLTEKHWLSRWHANAGGRSYLKEFSLPRGPEMAAWIRQRAEKEGGRFSPQAAEELAAVVGSDTPVAAQEIVKLLTYVNWKRPVERDDVQLLTVQANQADVFTLVDAMGARNGRLAIRTLHGLLEHDDPLKVFGMIIRQFRLLLLTREILAEGGTAARVLEQLRPEPFKVSAPYVADKLCQQANRFGLSDLKEIYRSLLAVDETLKTSQMEPETALDTLIAELAA